MHFSLFVVSFVWNAFLPVNDVEAKFHHKVTSGKYLGDYIGFPN